MLIKRRAALSNRARSTDTTIVKVRHPSCLKPTEPLPSTLGIPVTRVPSADDEERERRTREWAEFIERYVREQL